MLVMTFTVYLSGHQVFCKWLISEPTFLLPYKRELQTSHGPGWGLSGLRNGVQGTHIHTPQPTPLPLPPLGRL